MSRWGLDVLKIKWRMSMRCENCVWGTKASDKKIFCMLPGKCLNSKGNPIVKKKKRIDYKHDTKRS